MEEIFKIASSVSTPLALGGFFAAVVFFTFGQIISKGKFPKFTAIIAEDLLALIINRLFWLALIAMTLGFVAYILPNPASDPRHKLETMPSPPFSSPSRVTEHNSWRVFDAWVRQHPEIVRQYGMPKEVKFVSLHEQNFKAGYVAYNVSDAWSVWLFTRTNKFQKLGNPLRHLTPGPGFTVDENVFNEVTRGLNAQEKKIYRSLVEGRVNSAGFKGIGIIGGIGTLYIQNRLRDVFGPPTENEVFVADAVYASADGYEVLAGLRHGLKKKK